LVRADGFNLWIDAGPGTLANLQLHVGLAEVGAVVLSHSHPDHWSDVQGLYVAMRYFLRRQGVPVYGPQGLADLVRGENEDAIFEWHTIKEGMTEEIGPFRCSWSRTEHPVETLATRVEARGRALGYSADTGPGWPLSNLGEDLDLALVEASTTSEQEPSLLHLSARQAGQAAARAGAKRLVVTHLTPYVDRGRARAEASEAFGREAEVATIGRTWWV